MELLLVSNVCNNTLNWFDLFGVKIIIKNKNK